jgi:hypothetical protein
LCCCSPASSGQAELSTDAPFIGRKVTNHVTCQSENAHEAAENRCEEVDDDFS